MRPLVRTLIALGIAAALSTPVSALDPRASRFYEDALSRYEKKDLAGAIIQLKSAVQVDPKMLAAHLLLARALLASGDAAGAAVEFEESLRQGVSRAEVLPLLGEAYLLDGKYDALLERVTPAGLPAAQRVDVLLLRANAQSGKEDVPGAEKTLEEARALDPRSVPVRLTQAALAVRVGDPARAGRLVDEALSLAPNDAAAWNMRGSLQQSAGDTKGALASYAKASGLGTGYVDPRVARASLLVDLGRIDEADRELAAIRTIEPLEPRAAYLRAVIATRRGDKGAAKAALEEVTKVLDPIPATVLVNRKPMLLLDALAHYDLGSRDKASDKLTLFLRRYPGDAAGTKLLARLHLDAGNHAGAVALLEPLRRSSPNDARVLSLLATAYMQEGNYQGASELLDQAVRRSGGAPDILADFGITLAGSGKEEQAIEQLRRAWAKDPKQTRTGLILATFCLRAGQPKEALGVIQALAKNEPSNLAVLNMLGVARVASGDRAGGRKAYEQVLAQNPGHPGAILNLASLDVAEGKPEAARERLLGLLKTDGKNVEAMMEVASIEERAHRFDQAVLWLDKARAHPKAAMPAGTRLAELYLRTGDLERALSAAKDVLLRAPANLAALELVARVQLARGDRGSARQTLNAMARYANYDPAAQVAVARLQVAAGNDPGADYSIEKALGARADFLPARVLRAEIEIRRREFAQAEQRIREIGGKPGGEAVALRLRGDLALARGQQAEALAAYGKALRKDDNADTALRAYRAHAAAGDVAKGVAFLDKWQKGHPDDVVVLRTIGDAFLLKLGNPAAARDAYERILKLHPDDGTVWNNLALTASAQKDAAAAGFAERAYALRPNDPAVIDTLGWLLFRQGQVDRALALLRDARLRNSTDPEIRYHLAAALARSGRRTDAREEVAQALRAGASFAGIEDARALQAELVK